MSSAYGISAEFPVRRWRPPPAILGGVAMAVLPALLERIAAAGLKPVSLRAAFRTA